MLYNGEALRLLSPDKPIYTFAIHHYSKMQSAVLLVPAYQLYECR